MKQLHAEWRPDPKWPDIPDFKRAFVEIDGEQCDLVFVDRVAPSGRRYISVSVRAPYQGRGKRLLLEVNGVPLTLDWRGGNKPPFPARPTHAYYRVERLTPGQSKRLLAGPGPPPPPAPAGGADGQNRTLTWLHRHPYYRLADECLPAGITKAVAVDKPGDRRLKVFAEGGATPTTLFPSPIFNWRQKRPGLWQVRLTATQFEGLGIR